jgi:Protein of unknown function (DUF4230)
MIRRYTNIIFFVLALLLGWWLLQKANILPSIGDVFRSKPIRVDETPILIEDIRELAELTTYVSQDEVVVDSIRFNPAASAWKQMTGIALTSAGDRLVLVVRGSVKAGTRLNEISGEDIFREKDSVSMGLPRAVITEVIVNPSGTETFMETGDWTTEAFAALVKKAGDKMRYRAVSEGIIGKADQRARELIEQLLQQAGFEKVHVYTKY